MPHRNPVPQNAPTQHLNVQVVTSPGGITAWLIEDHMVPVVALQFAFRGGSALDPVNQAGLANLVASTLDEGAGDLGAEAFHQALEDQSIYLSFSAARDEFSGGVKTLCANAGEAWRLLRLALTAPRFDAAEVSRVQEQIISDIQHHYSDPQWVAHRTLNHTIFAGHAYAQPGQGFEQTVAAISPDDLRAWASARLARDNLIVAVSGAMTTAELAPLLDDIFGALPARSQRFELPTVTLAASGKSFLVPRGIPQTRVVMAQRGIARKDNDMHTAAVMNYVLGGGGFNSRLMLEVREKRGLTYGVSTQLQHNKYANLMLVSAATSNASAAEAVRIIREEWQKMAEGGISADELRDAQVYLTGSLPLALTSTDKIADFILHLQLENLSADYPVERLRKFNAVTVGDVMRVAAQMLDEKSLTMIAVGGPEHLANTEIAPDPAQLGGRAA